MKQMKKYPVKESYSDIQFADVVSYNSAIDELNKLYEGLEDSEDYGSCKILWNKKIDLQKEHMKRIKPNWLKR